MKKHPVDDLFSRKLRDAEIAPREEVYQKFQERLQTKQRRLGWWKQGPWLAAASVSLLFVAGWVVWRNYTSENTLTAQATPKIESIIRQKSTQMAKSETVGNNLTDNEEVINQRVSAEKQLTNITPVAVKETKESPKVEFSLPVLHPDLKQIAQVASTSEDDKTQIAPIVNESEKVVAQTTIPDTESKPSEKTVVLQLPELSKTLIATNEPLPIEREISTASAESKHSKLDDNLLNPSRKSTRIAKVWKQLKNAKNGEKVDWDEVGFNPNKLLAKATGKDF